MVGENKFFSEIRGNFGFGFMRLPMDKASKSVDLEKTKQMTDAFIEAGFNYFDTAHGYIDGQSETAIRECVAKRYDRSKFLVADKLTSPYFEKQEDIVPFFESQLEACGVDYFDFYLMHAQESSNYQKFKNCRAYETALELKEKGKIRHFGLSFHDKPEVLERILQDYPQVEFVQIQFNYADYDDASVESRRVYEVCEKYGKPVMVMEPVKGGSLVKLPEEAQKVFDELQEGSASKLRNAGYAIRFAASFPNICIVLSGMSTPEQMADNLDFMKDFKPLSAAEMAAVHKVCGIFRSMNLIPCTECRYCVAGCPKHIRIPDLFACMNSRKRFWNWNQNYYYDTILTTEGTKASDCIKCGKCEKVCPQHLPIRSLLEDVAKEFEENHPKH